MNADTTFSLETVQNLRTELLEHKKEKHEYRLMYFNACKERNQLQDELFKIKKKNLKLQTKIDKKAKSKKLHEDHNVARKRKLPSDQSENQSKRSRLDECRSQIVAAMSTVPGWKALNVSVKFPEQVADFEIAANTEHDNDSNASSQQSQDVDHSYCSQTNHVGEQEGQERDKPNRETAIFDDDGNFTKNHIRKAVLVTDNFRISNDAYHEIRSELAGHLPPLGQVKQEKYVMSEEIPYTKHATVSTFFSTIMYNMTKYPKLITNKFSTILQLHCTVLKCCFSIG